MYASFNYTQKKKLDLQWMQTRGIDSSHDVRRVANDQRRVIVHPYYNYCRVDFFRGIDSVRDREGKSESEEDQINYRDIRI
jgi:hypothetical protein